MNVSEQIKEEFNAISAPDVPLSSAAYQACAARARPRKRNGQPVKVLAAACLILLASLGTALAFNEEFRLFVISFFKSEQIEFPIDVSADPSEPFRAAPGVYLLGQQEIAGIADIRYYRFESGFTINDNTAAVKSEEDVLTVYTMNGNDFIELPQFRVEDTLLVRDLEIPLCFIYVIDGGKIKTFENVYEPGDGQATAVWSAAGESVWVNVTIRNELDTYVLYNLQTGEVRDFIREAGLEMTRESRALISPDEKSILVYDMQRAYLLDVETGVANELDALRNETYEMSISFIDSETLTVWQLQDSDEILYTVSRYDSAGGEKTVLSDAAPYYSPYTGIMEGIRGLGKGITVLTEPERYVLVDEKNGERYALEGIVPDAETDFLLSPDRSKVLVFTTGGQNGLGLTQLGCIDLEKRELSIFERKDFTDYETSLYWVSANAFAVAANGLGEYLYIYTLQ